MEKLLPPKLLTNSSPPSGFSASCTGIWPTSSRVSIRPDTRSTEASWFEPGHATNALLESGRMTDRKSTRLNSSHLGTSHAVFCLQKKTTGLYHGDRGDPHSALQFARDTGHEH